MDNSNDTTHAVKEEPSSTTTSDTINNHNPSEAAMQPRPRSLKVKPSLFALHEPSVVLDLTGASIRLQIGNTVIKTHERHLEKFARLRELIKAARQEDPESDTLTITLDGNRQLVDDFRKMFELLSNFSIGQSDCEVAALVSAARIAAPGAYGYDPLYHYCIDKLEGLALSSMERIHVARALGKISWEKAACKDLSSRKEMITKEEALSLGLDTYWQIASDREKRKGAGFERMLEGVQNITQTASAAKNRYIATSRHLFVFISLGFWLFYFLLWFNSGTSPIRFMIFFKASNVVVV
ncbi:unnamed protein product [Rhizoctonia solani]|uniref:BTB domain-containing protein n=1 Tax=Rhizoctonia solani TaxID=456999 RepID=A0A8H2XQN4_9AGAM|nr:unnamed protein product [Rhizoctonia solani]